MIEKLKRLIEEWEVNEKYFNNPWDAKADRYAGQAYGDCAKKLKEVLDKHITPNNTKVSNTTVGTPINKGLLRSGDGFESHPIRQLPL